MYWAKLSVLMLYLRVFGINRPFRYTVFFVMTIWTMYIIADVLVITFECNPVQKAWDPLVPGHCINIINVGVAIGYFNLITDCMILILPIPMLWSLQLALRMKLAVLAMFMTGVL